MYVCTLHFYLSLLSSCARAYASQLLFGIGVLISNIGCVSGRVYFGIDKFLSTSAARPYQWNRRRANLLSKIAAESLVSLAACRTHAFGKCYWRGGKRGNMKQSGDMRCSGPFVKETIGKVESNEPKHDHGENNMVGPSINLVVSIGFK